VGRHVSQQLNGGEWRMEAVEGEGNQKSDENTSISKQAKSRRHLKNGGWTVWREER